MTGNALVVWNCRTTFAFKVFIIDLVDTIGQVEGLHLYITSVELKTSIFSAEIYIISKITV